MFLPVTPQPSVHVYTAPRGAWSAPRGRSKVVEARDMLRPDRVGFAVTSRRALCIILLAAVGLRSCVQVPRIPDSSGRSKVVQIFGTKRKQTAVYYSTTALFNGQNSPQAEILLQGLHPLYKKLEH